MDGDIPEWEQIRQQQAEIERLRGQVDSWSRSAAEIGKEQARLRAEVKALHERCAANDTCLKWYDETLGERDAEIVRLQQIITDFHIWMENVPKVLSND